MMNGKEVDETCRGLQNSICRTNFSHCCATGWRGNYYDVLWLWDDDYAFLSFPMCATCSTHFILLDL